MRILVPDMLSIIGNQDAMPRDPTSNDSSQRFNFDERRIFFKIIILLINLELHYDEI